MARGPFEVAVEAMEQMLETTDPPDVVVEKIIQWLINNPHVEDFTTAQVIFSRTVRILSEQYPRYDAFTHPGRSSYQNAMARLRFCGGWEENPRD